MASSCLTHRLFSKQSCKMTYVCKAPECSDIARFLRLRLRISTAGRKSLWPSNKLLGRRRALTMTKYFSRKACYTCGHGNLKMILQFGELCWPSKRLSRPVVDTKTLEIKQGNHIYYRILASVDPAHCRAIVVQTLVVP